jgi:hypothetical protein
MGAKYGRQPNSKCRAAQLRWSAQCIGACKVQVQLQLQRKHLSHGNAGSLTSHVPAKHM